MLFEATVVATEFFFLFLVGIRAIFIMYGYVDVSDEEEVNHFPTVVGDETAEEEENEEEEEETVLVVVDVILTDRASYTVPKLPFPNLTPIAQEAPLPVNIVPEGTITGATKVSFIRKKETEWMNMQFTLKFDDEKKFLVRNNSEPNIHGEIFFNWLG